MQLSSSVSSSLSVFLPTLNCTMLFSGLSDSRITRPEPSTSMLLIIVSTSRVKVICVSDVSMSIMRPFRLLYSQGKRVVLLNSTGSPIL